MRTDDCIEDRLRRHFAEPVEIGDLVDDVVRRHRRRRARRVMALVAPVMIGAVGLVALASSASPSPVPRHPGLLELAGYWFDLPAGYRLTAGARPACEAITLGVPRAARTSPVAVPTVSPYATATVSTAVGANGGCVTMLVTPSATPTASTPTPYVRNGPAPSATRVQVGAYTGWLATQGSLTRWLAAQGLVAPTAPSPTLQLSVAVPVGGGAYRLLVLGSRVIAQTTLVRMVAGGLST
ncbi:MAG: hypothetical protein M0Z46_02095 [Actinomycetota bacterium]|nr:hypothetical protein [Actinomycetota bacterium]